MVINFKEGFAEPIRAGTKRQTLRLPRRDGKVPRVGELLYLYTGLRRPGACRGSQCGGCGCLRTGENLGEAQRSAGTCGEECQESHRMDRANDKGSASSRGCRTLAG